MCAALKVFAFSIRLSPMRLLFNLDTKDYTSTEHVFSRPSVRAIIIKDGKVGMIHSFKYDYYAFPGGGIESGETQQEALIRETQEEAGLVVIPQSIKEYGNVHRVSKSDQEGIDIFVQDNFYYLCDVEPKVARQHLDAYEKNEHYTLEWIAPKQAIVVNRTHDHGPNSKPVALEREALVLERLIAEGLLC